MCKLIVAINSMHLVKESLRHLRMKQSIVEGERLADVVRRHAAELVHFVCEGLSNHEDHEKVVDTHVLAMAMGSQQQRAEVRMYLINCL